jgi:hypothetical protein
MAEYKIKGLANQGGYRIKGPASEQQDMQQPIMPQPQAPQGSLSEVPADFISNLMGLGVAVGNKARQIPGEIGESAMQFYEHPLTAPPRAARSVLSGLLEGGKQLWNLPLELNTYLASKNVPVFKQTSPIAEKLKIGDTGLQQAVMGDAQPGDQLWQDIGSIAPMIAAPETVTSKLPAVTAKQIMKKIAADKASAKMVAKKEYGQLFSEAESQGISHAPYSSEVTKNSKNIIDNSQSKYHDSFKDYLENPTVENAHWAQSDLGALVRHLEGIAEKTGLTQSQLKTLKAAKDARSQIKKSMFSNNVFGANPALGIKYSQLSEKYAKDVVPYTRLSPLSKFEAEKMRPGTSLEKLQKDEEFMIDLAKKYPGLKLHSPTAKKIKSAGLGTIGALTGYDQIKKLLR